MAIISVQRANKLKFYTAALAQHLFIPNGFYRSRLEEKLRGIKLYDADSVHERVNYYSKLRSDFTLSDSAVGLADLPSSNKSKSAYYFDYLAVMRYFPASLKADIKFGDVRVLREHPSLVKSRPVGKDNGNNILLKLESVRHFMPIKDDLRFEDKKDLLVWRGAAWQPWRKDFLKDYWNHPLCDVGQVNPSSDTAPPEWVKAKMSVAEQLQYKFILSIEGNDVATNLKWIAQSNSLCFMTRPKFETWMMEGRLVDGKHYVELRDDYADVQEKIKHYKSNSEEAKQIIRNFKEYYQQFTDPKLEQLLSLMVIKKYADCTCQAVI